MSIKVSFNEIYSVEIAQMIVSNIGKLVLAGLLNNNDDPWLHRAHWIGADLPFHVLHDLRGLPLRRIPSTEPCSMIVSSVWWRQTWPNHDNLRRFTVEINKKASNNFSFRRREPWQKSTNQGRGPNKMVLVTWARFLRRGPFVAQCETLHITHSRATVVRPYMCDFTRQQYQDLGQEANISNGLDK